MSPCYLYPLSYTRIGWNAVFRVLDLVGNPKRTIENVIRRNAEKRRRMPSPAVTAPSCPARD
jgi:hypothetical protein